MFVFSMLLPNQLRSVVLGPREVECVTILIQPPYSYAACLCEWQVLSGKAMVEQIGDTGLVAPQTPANTSQVIDDRLSSRTTQPILIPVID